MSSRKAYNLVQDIIFWLDNPNSTHYTKTDYGSSFNTDAFCKEYAEQIKSLFLSIVGEDEIVPNKEINQEATDVIDAITRDQFRIKLRKSIKEL